MLSGLHCTAQWSNTQLICRWTALCAALDCAVCHCWKGPWACLRAWAECCRKVHLGLGGQVVRHVVIHQGKS